MTGSEGSASRLGSVTVAQERTDIDFGGQLILPLGPVGLPQSTLS